MNSKTEIQLRNFFIFNSSYGPKEGDELKKILYYYPITDNVDVQVNNVGLVEGIIQFTETFKPNNEVNSLHTQKTRQFYFQAEKNFWFVMTLNVPTIVKNKELSNVTEYLEDELQDNVYQAVLKEAYLMYRLLNGTLTNLIETENLGVLKTKLELFYKSYTKALKLANSDILDVFSGMLYLPLDTHTFLKVQCFINALECNYPQIKYTAFMYNDHLIWSGVNPNDMALVYRHLTDTLIPAGQETELRGSPMPRQSSSPFTATHGRFITVPPSLRAGHWGSGDVPTLHLYHDPDQRGPYRLLVYRAMSASLCLFLDVAMELTENLFKDLHTYMSPTLPSIVTSIAEYCQRQVATPSSLAENAPRFIYFSPLDKAYRSTAHLGGRGGPGQVACPRDLLRVIADTHATRQSERKGAGECIVKTVSDCWVVARASDSKEFYIILQQKNANLIDITEEVKRICDSELKNMFFHPL